MATSSREARRRRIVDGGSDRLAFITGQIRNLPSTPPSESQLRSDGSFPDFSPPPDQILRDRTSASTSPQENASDAGMLVNTHISSADRNVHCSGEESLQPQMSTETLTNAPASESRETIQPSPIASTMQSPSVANSIAQQPSFPLGKLPKVFTPSHIGTAVDASECTRMFSSLVIALLVILSRLGFSFLGSIISFRPVFLLLLTNTTIVLGRVLLNHSEDSSTVARRENTSRVNGHDVADQVGNALETALMMKKIMDAVFIDFSTYAVILICCLSFSHSNTA